jgi:hypothetical protein
MKIYLVGQINHLEPYRGIRSSVKLTIEFVLFPNFKLKTPEEHDAQVVKLKKSDAEKKRKLKDLGIDYEFDGYSGKPEEEVVPETAPTAPVSEKKKAKKNKKKN